MEQDMMVEDEMVEEGVPEEMSSADAAVEQIREAMDAPEFQPALISALTESKSLDQGVAALLSMLISGPIAQMGVSDEDLFGPEGVLVQLTADIMALASDAGMPEAEDPEVMQAAITSALDMLDNGEGMEQPAPEQPMPPGRKNGFAGGPM